MVDPSPRPIELVQVAEEDTKHKLRAWYDLQSVVLRAASLYPDIAGWLERVGPELSGCRTAYVAYVDGQVAGAIVTKQAGHRVKLCHLQVVEPFRRCGVGAGLLHVCLVQNMYFTVPTSTWQQYRPFFVMHGFTVGSATRQYRPNDPELYCARETGRQPAVRGT